MGQRLVSIDRMQATYLTILAGGTVKRRLHLEENVVPLVFAPRYSRRFLLRAWSLRKEVSLEQGAGLSERPR